MSTKKCKYRIYIDCIGAQDCNNCGWNPAVESKRKSKMKRSVPVESKKWIVGAKKAKGGDSEQC